MSIELREISEASRRGLILVEDAERRQFLEQFLDSTAPLVEGALRAELQVFVDEINSQLAPYARLRMVQEGTRLLPEIVSLGEENGSVRTRRDAKESISKVLVRMPSSVKHRATEAAQRTGISLNNWTVNILERALGNLREHQQGSNRPKSQGDESGTDTLSSAEEQETRSSNPEDDENRDQ